MTKSALIAAIRTHHLRVNIAQYEADPTARILWHRARIDPGGTLFGPGPYLKVPVWIGRERTVHRVYPPAWLRRRLLRERSK